MAPLSREAAPTAEVQTATATGEEKEQLCEEIRAALTQEGRPEGPTRGPDLGARGWAGVENVLLVGGV